MQEHRKVTVEQGDKRITLEQGCTVSQTPQWDKLTDSAKEGTAKYVTIFGRAFIKSLLPAFLLISGFLIILFLIIGGM